MEFQRAKEADFEGKWIPQPAQEKDLAELAAMIFDSELGRKYYPTEKTLLAKSRRPVRIQTGSWWCGKRKKSAACYGFR